MQKLIKRSLSMVLAMMMVVTMFAGTIVTAAAVEVPVWSMDHNRSYTGTPNNPTLETSNYLEGAGARRYDFSGRTSADIVFFGADGASSAQSSTTDISSAIDANGKTVLAFDLYVTDAAKFMGTRTVFGLMCQTDNTDSQNVNSKNAWMEINTQSGKNASWTADFGLENGLQNGWNHIAITMDTDDGENKYAHATNTRANYWNPAKFWKFRMLNNLTSATEQIVIFDDIRFMTPEQYASDAYKSEIAVKDVIAAINAIENKYDTDAITAATTAYEALTATQQAQVFNYSKLQNINFTVDTQLHSFENGDGLVYPTGIDTSTLTISTTSYTEGTGALKGSLSADTKKFHISFTNSTGWDFSKAEYLAFDMYVNDFTINWVNGQNDMNIGFGSTTTWSDSGLWAYGNSNFQNNAIGSLKEGWNHIIIPVAAQTTAVKNIRMYFENCVTLTGDDPYVMFDDLRILNANGKVDHEIRNAAKPVIIDIAGIDSATAAEITATKTAYDALTETQKATVTNYAKLEAALAALDEGKVVNDKIVAAYNATTDQTLVYHNAEDVNSIVNINSGSFENAAVDSENKTEGAGSVKAVVKKDITNTAVCYGFRVGTAAAVNPSNYDTLSFDMYVGEGVTMTNGYAYVYFADKHTNNQDERVHRVDIKAQTVAATAGKWTTVTIPVSDANFDGIIQITIRATMDATTGTYVLLDNLRFEKAGEALTYADKADVDALRAEYDALSASAKKGVADLAKLEAMEAAIKVEADKAAAVVTAIDALPTPTDIALSDKGAVEAARAAYDALADDTKAGVTNLAKLTAAEAKIVELEALAGDAEKAAAVDTAIEALPTATDVVVTDEAAITAARSMYDALTADQKAMVKADNVAKLTVVEAALAQAKADKAAADAVVTTIAALPAEITLDDKAAVEAARTAYDALSDKAKTYVTNLAVLEVAEDVIADLAADIEAAAAVEDKIDALPETITEADKAAVAAARAAYDALSDEAKALVSADALAALQAAEATLLALSPYDVQLRTMDHASSDFNSSSESRGQRDWAIEGTKCMAAVWTGTNSNYAQMHVYVYAYKQNGADDENGYNADGCSKFVVLDKEDMYMTFDLYVSDASILHNYAGDCGFNLDTVETGGKNVWGNAGSTKKAVVDPILKSLKDGWNHIEMPLTLTGAVKEGDSSRAIQNGDVLTVASFRLYATGLSIPEGWTVAVDDFHVMNGKALTAINALRNTAKDVTIGIDEFAEDATYEDFYALYAKYNALPEEYQAITLGWDEFVAAHEDFAAEAAEQFPADKAAADAVDELIAAFPAEVEIEDKDQVAAARTAYDALTDTQKSMVLNAAALAAAEQTIADKEKERADAAAAAAVDALIDAIPTPSDLTLADQEQVTAARAAYAALTNDQKVKVTGLMDLREAEAQIGKLTGLYEKAKPVIEMIAALPTPSDLTVDDKADVEAARAAYDALEEDVQAMVDNLDVLEAAEAKIAELIAVKLGDVNGDGKIDAGDALEVLKYAVGKAELTDTQKIAADVNVDTKIDAGDALEILKYAVGKPSVIA